MKVPIEILELIAKNIPEEILIDKAIKAIKEYKETKFNSKVEEKSTTEESVVEAKDLKKFLEEGVKREEEITKETENFIPPPITHLTMLASRWMQNLDEAEVNLGNSEPSEELIDKLNRDD